MQNRNYHIIYLTIILVTVLAFSLMTIYASSEVAIAVSARSAVLYEPETESILFSKDADVRLPMASTTKIMTALVAVESCAPSEEVEISAEAVGIEGSSAYLKADEVLSLEELLYALLLQSANDAAVAIAIHVSGSVEAFADMMNEKAELLGLSDTHFTNPHGLDDKEHYTTATELAKIAAAALDNPTIKKIAATYKKTFASEKRTRTYVNHNKLLRLYDGAIGVKTGFTKRSGRCLVGAAERDGLTLISVTLDAPDDWRDHEKMLNLGYEKIERVTFALPYEHKYEISVLGEDGKSITVTNREGASLILPKGQREISEYVKLTRFTPAPVKCGDILGEVIYTLDGEAISRISLVATEDVGVPEKEGFIKRIFTRIFGQKG